MFKFHSFLSSKQWFGYRFQIFTAHNIRIYVTLACVQLCSDRYSFPFSAIIRSICPFGYGDQSACPNLRIFYDFYFPLQYTFIIFASMTGPVSFAHFLVYGYCYVIMSLSLHFLSTFNDNVV